MAHGAAVASWSAGVLSRFRNAQTRSSRFGVPVAGLVEGSLPRLPKAGSQKTMDETENDVKNTSHDTSPVCADAGIL